MFLSNEQVARINDLLEDNDLPTIEEQIGMISRVFAVNVYEYRIKCGVLEQYAPGRDWSPFLYFRSDLTTLSGLMDTFRVDEDTNWDELKALLQAMVKADLMDAHISVY